MTFTNNKAETMYKAFVSRPESIPVSFTLDNKEYHGFGSFTRGDDERFTDTRGRECRTLTFTLGVLKSQVRLAYCAEFGQLEYTVYFTNDGSEKSPVIGSLCCADMDFDGENPILDGILGDLGNQYKPYRTEINEDGISFVSESGRATHGNFPYFNLEHGDGGTLMAFGWAGTWKAEFKRTGGKTRLKASSCLKFNSYLLPGEKIRTALVVLLPYTGRDIAESSNLWRRWFLKYNVPFADAHNNRLAPFTTNCLAADTGYPNSDGSISERDSTWKPSMDKLLQEKIPINYRWFDAGWYSDPEGNTVPADWWETVGSWELDKVKWPGKSFRESVEYGHAHGIKTFVWFEPERVTNPKALAENYGYNEEWAIASGKKINNNLGNPDCLDWTANRIIKFMRENDVDMYREDNNSDPCSALRIGDTRDADKNGAPRDGISENKAIQGHYELWDRILNHCRENGKCTFLDSCASGGGRNDIESLRRSIPVMRSDSDRTTSSLRLSMTASFNRWVPFCGASTKESREQLDETGVSDEYVYRASYLPVFNISAQWTKNPKLNFDILRKYCAEWKDVSRYLLDDMYILTDWHPEKDMTDWTVICYFSKEKGEGVITAFRMEECEKDSFTVSLSFTQGEKYRLTDADTGKETVTDELYALNLGKKRSSALVFIKKA